jgi:hypothetical protein
VAGLAIVTAIITVSSAAGRQGDNLGVAGVLDGRALTAATVAPLAGLPLGLLAVVLFIRGLVRLLNGADAGFAHTAPGRSGAAR